MTFYIKQNDTSPAIQATLKDPDGTVVNLAGSSVRFHMADMAGTIKVDTTATIVDNDGVVRYSWQAGDTDTAGLYKAEFEVTYADSTIETFPNEGKLIISIEPEIS